MVNSDEYQVGVHDIDTTGTIADESDVVEFEMETETVFKRLADDIYESSEAGIREPLMNAITSVRRAFDGNMDQGVIEITVIRGEQITLRIKDNGLGIPNEILENVLTVIGRSEVRDNGKLAGQYGMGFLASYKLVGSDGGFFMHTNPRNGDAYKGLFRPGAFEKDTDDEFPDILGNQSYGTAFEYHLKDSISSDDIEEWVEKHAKWSPVPIIYREIDENGNEVFNEDFGYQSLSDKYDTWISFENEYLEAVASPSATGDMILISSPMEMDQKSKLWKNIPWKVDVRLKYENGVIVDGSHKGLSSVTEGEYKSMSEDRKERYIPENKLSPSDIFLPKPIGTREKIESNSKFIKYVRERLNDEIKENFNHIIKNFDPVSDNYSDLDSNNIGCLSAIADAHIKDDLKNFVTRYRQTSLNNKMNLVDKIDGITDCNSIDASDDIIEFIIRICEELRVLYPDKEKIPLYSLAQSNGYEKTFVCVSSSTWKFEAVEKSPKNIRVVRVPKSNWYDKVGKYFGWEPLKNLDESRVKSELGLTDSEVNEIRDNKSSNNSPREKTLKIRTSERNSKSYKAEKVKNLYQNGNTGSYLSDYLILFPRGFEKNVGDNTELADNPICIASCSADVHDYLTEDCDKIMDYKEYKSFATNKRILSSHGEIKIKELSDYDQIVVCCNDYSRLEPNWKKVLPAVSSQIGKEINKLDQDNLIVISISPKDYAYISPLNQLYDFFGNILSIGNKRPFRYPSIFDTNINTNLLDMYAESKLKNDNDKEEMLEILDLKFDSLNKKSVEFIDKLSEISDCKNPKDNKKKDELPNHKTADGPMTISEIYSKYSASNVLIHVISPNYVDTFQSSEFVKMANKNLGGSKIATDRTEIPQSVFYVPILLNKFVNIQDKIKDSTKIIGNTTGHKNPNRSSEEQWFNLCLYADVKLHKWSNNKISDLTSHIPFDKGIKFIDKLKILHDNGEDPPDVPRTSNFNTKSSRINRI